MKVDNNFKLHGFNKIQVALEHQIFVPGDITLRWSPITIAGHFFRGELNGVAVIHTNRSTICWVSVKNGVLHGASVILGVSYIIEPVSFLHYIQDL